MRELFRTEEYEFTKRIDRNIKIIFVLLSFIGLALILLMMIMIGLL